MAERTPSPPTYGGPPLSSYSAPQDWRSRFTDAGNSLQATLSYYAGPHLSAVAKPLSELVQMVSPAADIIDAGENYRGAIESARSGDVPGAVAQTGYGLLSNIGLSEVSKPVAAIFAGVGAKTADLAKLKLAEEAEQAGADATKIWNETGWFRGADGKWRFEIDDSKSYYDPDTYGEMREAAQADGRSFDPLKETSPLGWVVGHTDAYEAYPDMEDIKTHLFPRSQLGANGAYSRDHDRLSLAADLDENEARSVALHEMQHAVQNREAFAAGGNPAKMPDLIESQDAVVDLIRKYQSDGMSFREAMQAAKSEMSQHSQYRKLAGEVEARNVQTRRDYTPEQRKAAPPWTTEDVPRDRQIVRMSNRDVLDKLQQMRAGK